MVAITVILAAVIAAFVFGMAGSISKTKVVAATAQQPDAQNIIVTYQGGQDAGSFLYANVTVNEGTGYTCNPATCQIADAVGSTLRITSTDSPTYFSGRDHVVVVGHFQDGSSQVIMDNFI